MLSKKQGAAAPTTARMIKHRTESYESGMLTSREILQQDIGELLFCLQIPIGELSQTGWALFERLLRRYMGLKCASGCLSEPLQSTISRQGVSG